MSLKDYLHKKSRGRSIEIEEVSRSLDGQDEEEKEIAQKGSFGKQERTQEDIKAFALRIKSSV